MFSKICNKCKEEKDILSFSKSSYDKDKHLSVCKACKGKEISSYRKTKIGLLKKMFIAQKHRNVVEYNQEYLIDRYLNNPIFILLYDKWVDSGYKKLLIPSIDRINNNIGYTKSNIIMTTWAQNKKNADEDMRKGILIHGTKPHEKIAQYTLKGKMIKEYPSACQASRETGIAFVSIRKVVRGIRKTAGGYTWERA